MPRSASLKLKDPFSSLSHALGLILSVCGVVVLLYLSHANTAELVACAVYGAGLIFVYAASAAYHATHSDSIWPQRLDHIAIYIMIAGTYTPVCILALPRAYGAPILLAEWCLALIGVVLNVFFRGGPNVLRVALYLTMGWMATVALGPLRQSLRPWELEMLLAGGITYTLGTVIYATERPRLWPGKFEAHDLWHIFVLAASACHFAMVVGLIVNPTLRVAQRALE